MTAPYRDILENIRLAFPQPVSDPIHDSYFVHSIMRALDQVDALKSHLPILGSVIPGDFEEARKAALPAGVSPVETVTSDMVSYLQGMTIFGHPHTQQNVIPPPTIPSLIGVLLSALHNPNIAWDEYSRLVAQAEVEAVGITARLVGYDQEQAGGVFTFGGTGTSLYGVKIGLEKACPQAMHKGVSEDAVLLVSEAGHYCAANIAGWLGIGTDNLVAVPTTAENEIDLAELGRAARRALGEGRKIAAIIATLGTTDAFGLDDLREIAALRDSLVEEFELPYSPHIHADAVIGWAWSVFNEYDFEGNPLGFRPRTVRALAGARRRIRHLSLADSLGVDFHKTGFAPYVSSLVLVKDRDDLRLVTRRPEQMPYLYHFGDHRPGMFTLETSRAGTGPLSALANFRLFGEQGLQVVLGHLVEMAQLLREHLEGQRKHHRAQQGQLRHRDAVSRLPPGGRYLCRQGQGVRRPGLAGQPAGRQRVQPQGVRVRARGGDGRPRGRHFPYRLLPAHQLPGADRRPEILHPVPVRRRGAHRSGRRQAPGGPGKDRCRRSVTCPGDGDSRCRPPGMDRGTAILKGHGSRVPPTGAGGTTG